MKKLLGTLIVAVTLVSATFGLNLSIGGRGMIGSNVGNRNPNLDGIVSGGGGYVNLGLIGGFGLQGEMNFVSSTIAVGENSATFTPCEVIDFPVLAWYNASLANNVVFGGGIGLNFSSYSDKSYVNQYDSRFNVGLALGLNLKYFFTDSFGIVLGGNAVFDFMKTQKTTSSGGATTIVWDTNDGSRKAIYGSIGLEFRVL